MFILRYEPNVYGYIFQYIFKFKNAIKIGHTFRKIICTPGTMQVEFHFCRKRLPLAVPCLLFLLFVNLLRTRGLSFLFSFGGSKSTSVNVHLTLGSCRKRTLGMRFNTVDDISRSQHNAKQCYHEVEPSSNTVSQVRNILHAVWNNVIYKTRSNIIPI